MTHEGALSESEADSPGAAEKTFRFRRRHQKAQETHRGADRKRPPAVTASLAAGTAGQEEKPHRRGPITTGRWRQVIPTCHDPCLIDEEQLHHVTRLIQEETTFTKFGKAVVMILPTRTLKGKEIPDGRKARKKFQQFNSTCRSTSFQSRHEDTKNVQ